MTGTVDISQKNPTPRRATARSILRAPEDVVESVKKNDLKKADPLPTARAAAMLAAKKTPELIPHCHPIAVTDIKVDFEFASSAIEITCRVSARDRTGAEMEALLGASTAALTIYDMIKAHCADATVEDMGLVEKSGGKSGHWTKEEDRDE